MKTATIDLYHVWGTPHNCVALFYRGEELTPWESPTCPLPQWIPADENGIERLRQVARKQGFTHVRFTGVWTKKPKRQKL